MSRLALTFFCFLAWPAFGGQQPIIAYGGTTPGLQYYVDGQPNGPATQVVTRLLQATGLPYEIRLMNWARAHRQQKADPNSLVYSIARLESREKDYRWLLLLGHLDMHIARLKSRPDLSANSLVELKQRNIAVIRHTNTHETLLKAGFVKGRDFAAVATAEELLKLVRAGMVDFVFYESTITPLVLESFGLSKDFLIPTEVEVPSNNELYLAAHPDFPEETALHIINTHERLLAVASYRALFEQILPHSKNASSQEP